MNRESFRKQAYIAPQCKVVQTDNGTFICASVHLNPGGSTQNGYDDKGEHDVGTVYFGDKTTVAPAKEGGLWDDED